MAERKAPIFAIVGILSIAVGVNAQVRPAFDVVSVKANNSGTGFVRIGGQPAAGRFVATNATVEMLITWAYRLQNYQLSGGPGWIRTDRFDIERRGGPVPTGGGRMAPGVVEASDVSIAMLTDLLAQQLGRPVIDKTGLDGFFDINLEWATDPNFAGPGPGGVRGPDIGDSTSGPSLFSAIEEQLGLRLESAKGPVETLVIDSVQRPQEN